MATSHTSLCIAQRKCSNVWPQSTHKFKCYIPLNFTLVIFLELKHRHAACLTVSHKKKKTSRQGCQTRSKCLGRPSVKSHASLPHLPPPLHPKGEHFCSNKSISILLQRTLSSDSSTLQTKNDNKMWEFSRLESKCAQKPDDTTKIQKCCPSHSRQTWCLTSDLKVIQNFRHGQRTVRHRTNNVSFPSSHKLRWHPT